MKKYILLLSGAFTYFTATSRINSTYLEGFKKKADEMGVILTVTGTQHDSLLAISFILNNYKIARGDSSRDLTASLKKLESKSVHIRGDLKKKTLIDMPDTMLVANVWHIYYDKTGIEFTSTVYEYGIPTWLIYRFTLTEAKIAIVQGRDTAYLDLSNLTIRTCR